MIRGLFKLVILVVVVVAIGAFWLGWWGSGGRIDIERPDAIGTAGVDKDKARAAGAAVGEKTAAAADQTAAAAGKAGDRAAQAADRLGEKTAVAAAATRKALGEGSLTAKIKAKMALDDNVKALDLNVDTAGSIVTVSGVVNTQAEKDRALALARETAGVTQVVDRVTIK